MNKPDKKHNSGTPDNWDEFQPETLLFATEVCMMDRDTKVIGAGGNGGYGALAGAIFGFIIAAVLLGLFQIIDDIQAPPQDTYRDYAPWKSARINPVTHVAIGPPTPKPAAVVAAPPKPPAAKPAAISEPKKQAAEQAAKAKEEAAKKAEAKAKAAEEAAKAEAEAKAAEEAAKAEAKAKAAEEAAKAEAKAKAAEEAAKAEAEAKAAEEAAKAEAEAKAAEEAATEAKAAEEAAKARAAKEAAAINHEADILNAVKSWANAWSDQKVDAYINSYTATFKPPQYKSRKYWEAQRRKRLAKPSSISIQLSNIQISLAEDGAATVTFVQIYKSPTFSDSVRKTLVLRLESGSWKISSETSEKL